MIAIVDDDKGVRDALEQIVRSIGHNACTFGSAEELLRCEMLHDILCLITDPQTHGLSGLDLQDWLIAEGHRIPIISTTSHPDGCARARAMKAGAYRRVRSSGVPR